MQVGFSHAFGRARYDYLKRCIESAPLATAEVLNFHRFGPDQKSSFHLMASANALEADVLATIDAARNGFGVPVGLDCHGRSPLHDACEHATPAVVEALLDAGAEADLTSDGCGCCPLSLAVRRGNVGAV